jgi:hypothetical protein
MSGLFKPGAPWTQSKPTLPVPGVAFAPYTRNCSVQIIVRLTCPPGASGRIELRSDTAATPTTRVAQCRLSNALTLLGLGGTVSIDKTLSADIPAGQNCVLASVIESGAPVISVVDYTVVTQ